MNTVSSVRGFACLLGAVIVGWGASTSLAQGQGPGDSPAVTVRGQTYTPLYATVDPGAQHGHGGGPDDGVHTPQDHRQRLLRGDEDAEFFLVTTPEGHILINSTYERNVRTIEQSVTKLGFEFSDIKILLGTHAHRDHQEGDALVKELTGAEVMMMAEDVPALERMIPGGKEHPIDRILRDGESVTLGGTTLVAHLAAGHTRGCTTWTTTAQEGGSSYDVVFNCSLRAPRVVTPARVERSDIVIADNLGAHKVAGVPPRHRARRRHPVVSARTVPMNAAAVFGTAATLARHTVTKTAVTTTVNIGFHGSILFAMFLRGWGSSMVSG